MRQEKEALSKKLIINQGLLLLGIILVLLAFMAPTLVKIRDFGIMELVQKSIVENSSDDLLFAAIRLVLINALRALPLYVGVLLIVEGLGLFRPEARRYRIVLPLLLVPAVYGAIRVIHGTTYDLGVPALSMIMTIIIVSNVKDLAKYTVHKVIIFSLVLLGVQWLDIVPQLTGFGFGRGQMSMEIKRVAWFLDAQDTLQFIGLALCTIFLLNAVITARLLNTYTREIKVVEQAWQLERMNGELQLRALENRSLQEIQSLVHDLKTPLTTIQGLAGVLQLACKEGDQQQHARRICDAADKMNRMISELLRDEIRQVISVKELLEYAIAYLPRLNTIASFKMEIAEGLPKIKVNRIKMSRALINLLNNALEAIEEERGEIVLQAEKDAKNVAIRIIDNGSGIEKEDNNRIWDAGFSTKNSSGLGLPFVRNIVAKNDGMITISSKATLGTTVTIILPGVIE